VSEAVRIDTISYGAFSQTFHERTMRQHLPLSGAIEVTRRCPLTCVHCYNNLPMSDREAAAGELTREELCRILDELADAGCLWLLFTGGEIFARRDFLDIYTYAKKKGFIITLFTNGTLITPRIADYLAVWRPFSIEITLYGRTRETYERLTGIPGSYDKCIRGIQLLRERSLPLALKSVAVTLNVHELGAMQEFADELGVDFKFDGMMNPRIDCSQSPLAVRLSPEDCVALDFEDPRRIDAWKDFAKDYLRPANPPDRTDNVYHCGGGVTSFAIDPQGGMSICVLSQRDKFDLRTAPVADGWRALRAVRGRKITAPTKCTVCELKNMCGMCPANGELENGDPESPVDFLCRVAHMRAYAFDLPVAPHGDCEYCAGGIGYDETMQSVRRLKENASRERSLAKPRLLPMLAGPSEGGCGSGGCSSCRG
jgi:radical SAM protein with 4Fe4S-binding SPASM domain